MQLISGRHTLECLTKEIELLEELERIQSELEHCKKTGNPFEIKDLRYFEECDKEIMDTVEKVLKKHVLSEQIRLKRIFKEKLR